MPRVTAIHHVALWTDRYDDTVAFYRDALGLRPIYQFPIGDTQRAMILRCGEACETGHVEIFERPDRDPCPAEARLLHFALATDDVDAMHAEALAAGATERLAPKDVDHGNTLPAGATPPGAERMQPRISFVVGLNGEVIEFFDDPLAR